MTTINPTFGNQPGQSVQLAQWTNFVGGDIIIPMVWLNQADRTVQIFGITGDSITIQGSNDPRAGSTDPTIVNSAAWATLTSNLGEPLVFDADGMGLIAEAPRYVRPYPGASLTAGTVIIVSNAG